MGRAEWLDERHQAAPAVSTVAAFAVPYGCSHTGPMALVLSPSHVVCERSAVAFLLMNPGPEMAWGCVFCMKSSFFPPALPQPL